MMRCGLLGRKLGHSYSPQIHAQLASYPYHLFEIEPDALGEFLKSGDFTGINVTIPYKKDVLPYCTRLSPEAEMLGAVNTIVRQADGTLVGHNTDYFGFRSMLEKSGLSVAGKKVLVLGTGGASATVCAVLTQAQAHVVVISRNGDNNYSNLRNHADASVIVNATPVGMYPDTDKSPLDLEIFPSLEGVLDLVYNPARTLLLQQAQQRGIVAENGLWMLVAQAKESACWFQGAEICDDRIMPIYNKLKLQMENIVLIGMPGCGKSTIGQLLANQLGKEFVDADSYVEEMAQTPVPDIINKYGEAHFRALETKALSQLGKRSGLVIATGGGCVTRSENYPLLHANGRIVWLQRDISQLPTDGRPLSDPNKLNEMFEVRRPLYASFCDLIVQNEGTPDKAVKSIYDLLLMEE